jgi:hypothetical protein
VCYHATLLTAEPTVTVMSTIKYVVEIPSQQGRNNTHDVITLHSVGIITYHIGFLHTSYKSHTFSSECSAVQCSHDKVTSDTRYEIRDTRYNAMWCNVM